MSLQQIYLRKLLKIMYLQGSPRISALRADIRDDLSRERGESGDGGDFYGPFWRDAKDHVFGVTDLRDTSRARIERNGGRARLYSALRDGFLVWWNERRRWTNEPFRQADSLKTVCRLPGIDANIKIANILAVRDGRDEDHFVYPYWFPEPALTDEAGRLALWALAQSFASVESNEIRVLDIIRGQTFALDRNPLRGDEGSIFQRKFDAALSQWMELRREYE